jgi:hypothetical protein
MRHSGAGKAVFSIFNLGSADCIGSDKNVGAAREEAFMFAATLIAPPCPAEFQPVRVAAKKGGREEDGIFLD